MCQLSSKIEQEISDLARIKFSSRGSHRVGMLNSDDPSIFSQLCSRVERILSSSLSKGEIITIRGSGEIWDQSQLQARILDGKYYEIYCFECNSCLFLRIWLEHSPLLDKTWVSLDLDEISNSPWFNSD